MSKKKLTLSQALLLTSRNPDVRVIYNNPFETESYSYTGLIEAMGKYKHEWMNQQEYTIDPVCLVYMAFSYNSVKKLSMNNPDLIFLGKNTDFWFLDKEATNETVTELFRKEGIL